jgi:hypothetical protein
VPGLTVARGQIGLLYIREVVQTIVGVGCPVARFFDAEQTIQAIVLQGALVLVFIGDDRGPNGLGFTRDEARRMPFP